MTNPAQKFSDTDYPAITCDRIDSSMSAPVDYLKGCAWLCGDIGPVCTRPQLDNAVCVCGHYGDCHLTVRFEL
jgi:hypothetical protein